MSIPVGLDISKLKIDYYYGGNHGTLENEVKSIKEFFIGLDKSYPVVMESTGKYHRVAHRELERLGFSVMVINPFQSKHFSKALNLICKTDKVDAKMLSQFGEQMEFRASRSSTRFEETLQNLVRHYDDLKGIAHSLKVRLQESDGFVGASLESALKTVNEELLLTREELERLVDSDEELSARCCLLETIPGVGKATAIVLLCLMKELGLVNKQEISALAGLAPINNDSGTQRGKRRIRGGRHDVRAHLYMPAVGAATQHNPRLTCLYERLLKAGKPPKVALTACMRKLVVWSNAILASGTPWNASHEEALALANNV